MLCASHIHLMDPFGGIYGRMAQILAAHIYDKCFALWRTGGGVFNLINQLMAFLFYFIIYFLRKICTRNVYNIFTTGLF
jgi:hypothetical protein